MSKIFRYECRRLLLSKFFFGLVAVTCFYGWQVLEHVTILGIAHTAPFSPWSFGDYLSRLLPLLWLGKMCIRDSCQTGQNHFQMEQRSVFTCIR